MKKILLKLLLVFFLIVFYSYFLFIQSIPDKLVLFEGENINIKKLFGISIKQENEKAQKEYMQKRNKKKAIVLSISIFLYCIATFALPYMIEVLRYEDAHAVMIWATLCTIATVIIVYFFVAYPDNTKNDIKEDVEETFELFFALFSSILLDRPCLRKKAGPS